ncbi:hypothetical protein F4808DRAFT_54739 [Astrocystis sublimbata]|nr:hypothetical protein F4808DRAFT_54739 [Astrocystis sublimbata]
MSSLPATQVAILPWNCRIAVDPSTHWPLHKTIDHNDETCRCKAKGGVDKIIRRYLFICAVNYYYLEFLEEFNALACMVRVKEQADKLDIDLDGVDVWDVHPDVLPARPEE